MTMSVAPISGSIPSPTHPKDPLKKLVLCDLGIRICVIVLIVIVFLTFVLAALSVPNFISAMTPVYCLPGWILPFVVICILHIRRKQFAAANNISLEDPDKTKKMDPKPTTPNPPKTKKKRKKRALIQSFPSTESEEIRIPSRRLKHKKNKTRISQSSTLEQSSFHTAKTNLTPSELTSNETISIENRVSPKENSSNNLDSPNTAISIPILAPTPSLSSISDISS